MFPRVGLGETMCCSTVVRAELREVAVRTARPDDGASASVSSGGGSEVRPPRRVAFPCEGGRFRRQRDGRGGETALMAATGVGVSG